MKSRIVIAVAGVALCGATGAAAEEPLGTSGQIVLSGERLFGVTATTEKETTDQGGVSVERKSSTTRFTLLGIGNGSAPAAFPRLAIDGFVAEGVSIGGSVMFVTQTSEVESTSGSTTTKTDGPKLSGFLLAPRVGYATMLSDAFGLWPRAGITYYSLTASDEIDAGGTVSKFESSETGLALDLEGMLAYSPASHVAIIGGPVFDLPLSGTDENTTTTGATTTTTKQDDTFMDFGVLVGVAGYF